MPDRILKVFILQIALSTWILTLAMLLDLFKALELKTFPCVKAGMFNVAFFGSKRCRILKPLSAIISSFSSTKSTNFDSLTIAASEIEPLYTSDKKEIAPHGNRNQLF